MKTVTFIDPPGGWRYGFPKILPEGKGHDLTQWLLDNGYPKDDILLALAYSRYWQGEVDNETAGAIISEGIASNEV